MRNLEFFRRYAYYYLYAIAAVLILTMGIDRAATAVWAESTDLPVIVIDPGHGGSDGGTVSATGQKESEINLQISLRLHDLLTFLGLNSEMLRIDDISLGTDTNSIRAEKVSDLKNRVARINEMENALVLSIHQNHFPESRYAGPQVFCTSESKDLAEKLQQMLNTATGGTRNPKKAEGIYLMEHIRFPGVLIECGFLSNPREENLLKTPDYQKKLACVIGASVGEYLISQAAA